MSGLSSKLCIGTVTHRRCRPVRHALRYRVFSLLLDLDELESVDRKAKLLRINRRGIVSWWERDHGLGKENGLKNDIKQMVCSALGDADIRRVVVLCFPRLLGYVFNPLTVYFCRDSSDKLLAMVYEVNNTFGGRHFYVVPAGQPESGVYFHAARKAFYVSPFNEVAGDYTFHVQASDEKMVVGVNLKTEDRPLLTANLIGRIEPLNDTSLVAALVRTPLLTFKVIAGIHFEALKLWLKGLRLTRRPSSAAHTAAPPRQQFTLKHD